MQVLVVYGQENVFAWLHADVVGWRFQSLWIAKGEEKRWDLWLVDWESKWACRAFFGFGGSWELGRRMVEGGKEEKM